jgi:hypothetical protein
MESRIASGCAGGLLLNAFARCFLGPVQNASRTLFKSNSKSL